MIPKIITFGSATRDIFLRAKGFLIKDFHTKGAGKEIVLPYGLKINIDNVHFHSGGGGTNTAATFSSQGFKVYFYGILGTDAEGEEVMKELKEKGIDLRFVARTSARPTDLSIIFSTPKERTILVYRGASQVFNKSKIVWSKIRLADWFYLAPLSYNVRGNIEKIIKFAKKEKIRVMANPSSSFLRLSFNKIISLLKNVDILLLNEEEAQLLIGNCHLKKKNLLLRIKKYFPGILIISNGFEEVFVADQNNNIYSVLPEKVQIVDKTGAGDALGAGFLSGYIKNNEKIIPAIQLGVANAVSCLKKWGAKEGILRKNQSFKKQKVKIL